MVKDKIQLDIVSDIACPWCYVGKRNIEAAMLKLKDLDIEVNWKPFQLDPTIAESGRDRETYLVNKFGSLDNVQGMLDRLQEAGDKVGIKFDWMKVVPNTMNMHKLLHVAKKNGYGNELKEAFFKAYFEDVVNLTDNTELLKIVKAFGMSEAEFETTIENSELVVQIRNEIAEVQQKGVTGVPFFIINNKYGISGAHPPEALEKWIRNVKEELSTVEVCDVDQGNC